MVSSRPRLVYVGAVFGRDVHEVIDSGCRWQGGPAARADVMQPQLPDGEAADDLSHSADVVAVGVGQDREVDDVSAVELLDVLGECFSVVPVAGVDHHDGFGAAVWAREAHADGVA